jgi:F0F1-type ATP synthase membrane subunit b/b'
MMMSNLILMAVVFAVMLLIIYKNINSAMEKHAPVKRSLDENGVQKNIYKEFANYILSVIDELKDATKGDQLVLTEVTKDDALEFYAQTIRRLMFFDTMTPDSTSSDKNEEKLFAILADIDQFLEESYEDGERLSDEIRERLQQRYEELKR